MGRVRMMPLDTLGVSLQADEDALRQSAEDMEKHLTGLISTRNCHNLTRILTPTIPDSSEGTRG